MSVRGEERRRTILDLARVEGRVQVAEESERLDVAAETVRRDLQLLEDQGLLRRTHGGAVPVESASFETTISARSSMRVAEKRRIASAAAEQLSAAETVYVDEGFTTQLVAELLVTVRRPLTVVTSSLATACVMARAPHHSTLMLGGRVRHGTLATVDQPAIRMLESLHIDLAFLGANGITREQGLTTPDPAVAEVKRTAVAASRRKVLVGTVTKFGAVNFCQFAQVADIDVIVTETALSAREAHLYSALGPQVVRV